jgi:hypothetical protein
MLKADEQEVIGSNPPLEIILYVHLDQNLEHRIYNLAHQEGIKHEALLFYL